MDRLTNRIISDIKLNLKSDQNHIQTFSIPTQLEMLFPQNPEHSQISEDLISPIFLNSTILDELEMKSENLQFLIQNCFFKLFGIDCVQSFEKMKAQSKTVIEKLFEREQKIKKTNSKMINLTNEFLEIQNSIKRDKKKWFTIIMSNEREIEELKRSLNNLQEGLKLREELTKTKEENLRLKNKIENQTDIIENLKKYLGSEEHSGLTSKLSSNLECLENSSGTSEITKKLEDFNQQKENCVNLAQEMALKLKSINAQLAETEEELRKAILNLKGQTNSGLSNVKTESIWKSKFESSLENIEKISRKVISLKKEQSQMMQDIIKNDENLELIKTANTRLQTESSLGKYDSKTSQNKEETDNLFGNRATLINNTCLFATTIEQEKNTNQKTRQSEVVNREWQFNHAEFIPENEKSMILKKLDMFEEQTIYKNDKWKSHNTSKKMTPISKIKRILNKTDHLKKNNEVLMDFFHRKITAIVLKITKIQKHIQSRFFEKISHGKTPKNFQKITLNSQRSPLRGFQKQSFLSLNDSFTFEDILFIYKILKASKKQSKSLDLIIRKIDSLVSIKLDFKRNEESKPEFTTSFYQENDLGFLEKSNNRKKKHKSRSPENRSTIFLNRSLNSHSSLLKNNWLGS